MTRQQSPELSDEDRALVFSPLQLGNVRLRNRIVRAAHGTGLSRGAVTDELREFHLARARGGVALSFTEAGEVHWSSPGFLELSSDAIIDGLSGISQDAHAEGMALFQQLMHGGPTTAPHDGSAPWAASPIVDPILNIQARGMTQAMIDELVAGFAAAARRVKQAGLDGVEVHGGHGYIFSTFLNPKQNVRTDKYGGDLDGRMRFLVDVLGAIRAEVGADFVVGVRLSPDGPPGHTSVEDIQHVVSVLERHRLIDYVNASWGSHYKRSKLIATTREPRGYMLPVTTQITRATSLPTMVTGRILSLADAAAILRAGDADMVSMVRALIADPDLVTKTERGEAASIRPCISCSQACAGGLNTRGRIGCVVNVGAGREATLGDAVLRPTTTPRHLLVIGGGPGGLEAARVAALVGHRVTLVEAADEIGGQLRLVRNSLSRSDVANLIPYYRHELDRLGVDVRLGIRIDSPEQAQAYGADHIVLATGATPRRDGFQAWRPGDSPTGFDTVELLTGWDVLEGADVPGPVVLVDEISHYESLDVAERLLQSGRRVHYVTRFHSLAAQIPLSYEYSAAAVFEDFTKYDFRFHGRSLLLEVAPGSATIAPVDGQHRFRTVDAASFVFMSGHTPDYGLVEAFETLPNVTVVGDAVAPRTLEPAITEGHLAPAALDGPLPRRQWVRWGAGSAV
jgi:2,4-dienoyl-CoA reductase-like NADH-dependent reductase (Old Yellow Enzyme family)